MMLTHSQSSNGSAQPLKSVASRMDSNIPDEHRDRYVRPAHAFDLKLTIRGVCKALGPWFELNLLV